MKRIGTRAYIKTLLKDPDVASITPTSNFGVKKLLSTVDFQTARFFIEYGPGGGVITKELLRRMSADSQLLVIEKNETFANSLANNIQDKRLIIKNDSAENVKKIVQELIQLGQLKNIEVDHIISGIPFSMFSMELRNLILDNTRTIIKPGGSFLVYQFLISLTLAGGKSDIKRKMREYFNIIRSEVELRNVPPLRIFEGSPRTEIKIAPSVKNKIGISSALLNNIINK